MVQGIHYQKYLLYLLMLLLVNLNPLAAETIFKQKSGFQWYPFSEWSIGNSSYQGNPFDVVAKAVFTHEKTGTSITTPMFYGEDNTWKFRFTSHMTGIWSFKTISDEDKLNGWSGKICIKKNPDKDAHGFMKSFGNKWGWEGTGEVFIPQYVMGKNLRMYIQPDGTIDTKMIDADIDEFINGHGFTGFHFAVEGDWFEGENPDRAVYTVLETIIAKVHQLGGGCHFWLWGAHTKPLNGPPMNDKDKRNLRYLASRLGPLPGWSIGYGYDVENGWASREQLDTWKQFLEQQMGWKHFIGARVGSDEKGLYAVEPRPPRPPHDENFCAPIGDEYCSWLGGDYLGYTSYRPLYDRYREAINHHPDKPSFEEDRFRLRDIEGWKYKDYDEELTRRGLWHSTLAGGVANIWGNFLPHDEGINYNILNTMGSKPYQIKDQIKTYSRFFEKRFLRQFESKKEEESLVLFTPKFEHVIIYSENTDEICLQNLLHNMKDRIIAVDTKSKYKEMGIKVLKENKTWKAPYKSDWAIAIGF